MDLDLDALYASSSETEEETRRRFSVLNLQQSLTILRHLEDRLRLYQRIRSQLTADVWNLFAGWANDHTHYPEVYQRFLETTWEAKTANLSCMRTLACIRILQERLQELRGPVPPPRTYHPRHGWFTKDA